MLEQHISVSTLDTKSATVGTLPTQVHGLVIPPSTSISTAHGLYIDCTRSTAAITTGDE